MSKADDIFWRQFGIILVILTLFGFAVAFIARDIAGDAHQTAMNSPAAVAKRIAPVGAARVGDPAQVVAATPKAAAAPAAAMSALAAAGPVDGEQIYNTACVACHAAGVAGAPKTGDAAAWAPRIELGEDALVASVLAGKGAMPPKAGNPNLTEEQIRAAVQYLTGSGGGTGTGAESSAMAAAKEVVASATEAAAEAVKDAAASAGDTAQQAVDKATDVASNAGTAVGQAAGAVTSTVANAASSVSAAATAAVGSVAAAAGVTTAPALASAGKPGDEIYKTGCVACHATGAANAPKLDDKAAWELRAASGFAALLHSVVNGKGAMPPRGGLSTLSDADIENSIRYMLKEAGVEAGG